MMEDALAAIIDYRGKTPQKAETGIPTLSAKSVKNNYINYAECYYISEEEYKRFMVRGFPQKGDILLTTEAPMGMVARLDRDDVAIAQRLLTLRGKIGILDNDYLLYLLQSPYGQGLLKAKETGTTVTGIKQAEFRRIVIKLPDIAVQKKVTAILNAIDSKISCNTKINDNLERQAATVFSEWLNKCTETTSIGELSNNILDYTPITTEMVRLLNSSDVTEGVFPVAPLVPNKDLKGHFKKRFQFGDILYSEIRPRNHHYGYVMFDTSDYIASTRLMVIRAITSKVSPALLYQYLLLPGVEAEFTLKTESRSGTFPQGNYADMASIIVPYSSIESQSTVSDILLQIRKTIAQNQLENRHLEELRDTLLPHLMSGEIDVSAIDI